jgi:hypothetical protein
MEGLPPGGWDLGRPNLIFWYTDLAQAPYSKGLDNARNHILHLEQRIDAMRRIYTPDDDEFGDEGAGAQENEGQPDTYESDEGADEVEEQEIDIVNRLTVSNCHSTLLELTKPIGLVHPLYRQTDRLL